MMTRLSRSAIAASLLLAVSGTAFSEPRQAMSTPPPAAAIPPDDPDSKFDPAALEATLPDLELDMAPMPEASVPSTAPAAYFAEEPAEAEDGFADDMGGISMADPCEHPNPPDYCNE